MSSLWLPSQWPPQCVHCVLPSALSSPCAECRAPHAARMPETGRWSCPWADPAASPALEIALGRVAWNALTQLFIALAYE